MTPVMEASICEIGYWFEDMEDHEDWVTPPPIDSDDWETIDESDFDVIVCEEEDVENKVEESSTI